MVSFDELDAETKQRLGIAEDIQVGPDLAILARLLLTVNGLSTRLALSLLREAIQLIKNRRDRESRHQKELSRKDLKKRR